MIMNVRNIYRQHDFLFLHSDYLKLHAEAVTSLLMHQLHFSFSFT
jgi:hypothetical protein